MRDSDHRDRESSVIRPHALPPSHHRWIFSLKVFIYLAFRFLPKGPASCQTHIILRSGKNVGNYVSPESNEYNQFEFKNSKFLFWSWQQKCLLTFWVPQKNQIFAEIIRELAKVPQHDMSYCTLFNCKSWLQELIFFLVLLILKAFQTRNIAIYYMNSSVSTYILTIF